MRSNLSVGPPIHLFRYLPDSLRAGSVATLGEGDAYLLGLRKRWADGLRSVFEELPGPPLEPPVKLVHCQSCPAPPTVVVYVGPSLRCMIAPPSIRNG